MPGRADTQYLLGIQRQMSRFCPQGPGWGARQVRCEQINEKAEARVALGVKEGEFSGVLWKRQVLLYLSELFI